MVELTVPGDYNVGESDVGTTNCVTTGTIESWSDTEIVFSADIYGISDAGDCQDDFSFVLLGQ